MPPNLEEYPYSAEENSSSKALMQGRLVEAQADGEPGQAPRNKNGAASDELRSAHSLSRTRGHINDISILNLDMQGNEMIWRDVAEKFVARARSLELGPFGVGGIGS